MANSKRKLTAVMESEQAHSDALSANGDDSSVAATLREARQRAGYDLRDVAEALRIRYIYLEAIEAGRFKDLPGSVYAVGFVRTYAELLGLDGDELVRRFKDEVSGIPAHTELNFPAPVPEGRVPGGALLMIALLLAAGAYGGWYYLSSQNRTVADLVPDLPARFAALLSDEETVQTIDPVIEVGQESVETDPPASADAPPISVAEARATDLRPPPPSETPEPVVLASPPTEQPLAAASSIVEPTVSATAVDVDPSSASVPAAAAPVEEPTGDVAPAAATAGPGTAAEGPAPSDADVNSAPVETAALAPPPVPPAEAPAAAAPAVGRSGIVITATAQSWVQVRDASGDLVMTRVLQPGEVYEVPDTDGLRMVTGNAGGIRITVNGTEAPTLGGPGDVVRNIALDGDRLIAGNAIAN